MAQLMECKLIAVCFGKFRQMILDVLVSLRNDEVGLGFVRDPVNQRLNVSRNYKPPRRVEGLVQIPDHILCTDIQLAALKCDTTSLYSQIISLLYRGDMFINI